MSVGTWLRRTRSRRSKTWRRGLRWGIVLYRQDPSEYLSQLPRKTNPVKPSRYGELRIHPLATGLCNNHHRCCATTHAERDGRPYAYIKSHAADVAGSSKGNRFKISSLNSIIAHTRKFELPSTLPVVTRHQCQPAKAWTNSQIFHLGYNTKVSVPFHPGINNGPSSSR